jgi:flavin reductase
MLSAIRSDDVVPFAVSRDAFVAAMSRAVTGVSLVTTDGPAGRYAVTVSAVASVSADPPMVLACVNQRSPLAAAIRANGVFCVNLLSAEQARLADIFAGRPDAGKPFDFASASWREAATGAPCLEGALASFDCASHDTHDAGTHTIFIGRVVQALDTASGTPLLYAARRYGRPDHQHPDHQHIEERRRT